jgi:hypothetical protein
MIDTRTTSTSTTVITFTLIEIDPEENHKALGLASNSPPRPSNLCAQLKAF